MKRQLTRKLYILYLVIMLVSIGTVFFLASIYSHFGNVFKILFRLICIEIILEILFMFYMLLKINKKEIDNRGDERELFIISKATSITGIVALSFIPAVMLFILVLPDYILEATFMYISMIGTVMKISLLIYNKKI